MTGLLLLAALIQHPAPFARTRLEPAEIVTVGQPVSIVVEVLVPSYFMGAPRYPDLDIPDALVLFEPRGTNFTERVGAETFAAQSRSYTVYPQRAGRYSIAEIPVAVRFFGGSGPVETTVSPQPFFFEARLPPEAEGLGYFIATTKLTVSSRLDPETTRLHVGEAVTRTVTITVEDALSMVVPPFDYDPIPGLGVYPESPVVRDRGGVRGEKIAGTRVEAASYVAEKEGHYVLPAVELTWWDVDTERMRSASAPAVALEVIPNPDLTAAFALPPEERTEDEADARKAWSERLKLFGAPAAAVFLLAVLLLRFGERERVETELVEPSEEAFFRRFRKAARTGDPRAAARTLMFWLDRAHSGPGIGTFQDLVDRASDSALTRQVEALDAVLYGARNDVEDFSGRKLYRRVAAARDQSVHGAKPLAELPPLNP